MYIVLTVQNKNYFNKHYSVRGSNNFRVQMFLQLPKLLAKLLDKSLCCPSYNSKCSNTRASIYLFQLMYQIFYLVPNNFTSDLRVAFNDSRGSDNEPDTKYVHVHGIFRWARLSSRSDLKFLGSWRAFLFIEDDSACSMERSKTCNL